MPTRNNDFTVTEAAGDNFAAALDTRQAVAPTTAPTATTAAQAGNVGAAPTQLRTSGSVGGSPTLGVSIHSVSDIMQGAALHKSPGLMSDQFNQILSSDMQAIITTGGGADTVLGAGRQGFTPYDILTQQGRTDGKIQFSAGAGGGEAEQAANTGAVPAATASGELTENPDGTRSYTHPNLGGNGPTTITLVEWNGFTMAQEFMARFQPMYRAAEADGIILKGSAWRSYERQIELRTSNGCPDVYTASSSSCRVPTARPGFSNHEDGNAIDIDRNSSTAGWLEWLKANAGTFQIFNLPSESWHWSIDGN